MNNWPTHSETSFFPAASIFSSKDSEYYFDRNLRTPLHKPPLSLPVLQTSLNLQNIILTNITTRTVKPTQVFSLHLLGFLTPFRYLGRHRRFGRRRCTIFLSWRYAVQINEYVDELKTNLMSLAILFHFLCAQHVSDINISIFRSLRLCCWITTSTLRLLDFRFQCAQVSIKSKTIRN